MNSFLSYGGLWFPGALLCVGVLLFLRYALTNMYNAGVTSASPASKFIASLTHPQMCAFWPMSHLKLFWIDMFLGRVTPKHLPLYHHPQHPLLSCTGLTRLWILLIDPFWIFKPVRTTRGKSFWNWEASNIFWKETWTSIWSPEFALDLAGDLWPWVLLWSSVSSSINWE